VKIQLKDTLKNIPFQIIGNANAVIHTIYIDSRSLQSDKNTLFFALKGKKSLYIWWIKFLFIYLGFNSNTKYM